MTSVGKLIKLGKYASKTVKFLNAPNRISELIEKGYSEEMAQKMAYVEIGLTIALCISAETTIAPSAIEAGGMIGFEIGLTFTPVGGILGGAIGSALAVTAANYIAGQAIYEFCKKFSEKLFEDELLNDDTTIDLSKIPATIQYSGPKIETLKLFHQAQSTKPIVVDPILVDLNGDGVKTTTIANGGFFDHNGDGFAELSAWVNKDDGALVIDKNNDGVINNGNEIFGDNYVKADGSLAISGFDALRDLDSNGDGIIDSSDERFNEIKVLKGDNTLLTLEEAGISSINLGYSSSNTVDESGNTIVSTGTFVKTDGTVGQLADYNLQVDKLNSFATEWLDETDEVAILPDVMGSGTMHSLHQAILRDESGELKTLLENYLSEENIKNRSNLITDLVYKWAGVENINPTSRGGNIDARKIAALEKFMGEGFIGVDGTSNPNNQAANILEAVLRLGFNQRQKV